MQKTQTQTCPAIHPSREPVHPILYKAAESLMAEIKQPWWLLFFFTKTLKKGHHCSKERQSPAFSYNYIANLMEKVLVPWMKPGSPSSRTERVANGILELYNIGQHREFDQNFQMIMDLYAYDGAYNFDAFILLKALHNLGSALLAYEYSVENSSQQKAS